MTYIPTANPWRVPNTFLPKGWDDGWRAAKVAALAGSPTPANIMFLGPSSIQGYGSSDPNSTSWRWLLRNRIIALLGQGADYFPLSQSRGETMANGTATGGSSTTLVTSGLTASALVNQTIYLESGPGAGQYRTISANTTTTITISTTWDATKGNAASGSVYHVGWFPDGFDYLAGDGRINLNAPWRIGSTTQRSEPAAMATGSPYAGGLFYNALPESPVQAIPGECSWVGSSVATGGAGVDQLLATYKNPAALGNCTDYDIWFQHRNTSANNPAFKWAVDAGAKTSVNHAASSDLLLEAVQIRSLSNAAHEIQLYMGNVLAQNWLCGVTAYKSLTAGARFAHLANAGQKFTTSTSDVFTSYLLARDTSNVIGGGVFPMKPDLCILELSIGDAGEQGFAGLAKLRQNVGLLIECARRVKPNCSIILTLYYYPNGIASDSAAAVATMPLIYEPFAQVIYYLAQRYDCAIFDLARRWNNLALTSGFHDAASAGVHANDTGQADVDAMIGPYL